ncbi:hypothetical protein [Candidatus Nardonella dryophthoridicola]|uniref:Uncharacterized protein n=1 Tax=endosymbiont of Metamasius hemipterus TaxID=204627 RepID=A0ABT0TWA4_9GAMM|nr:hypothetical protein [Candidatus Nardonella dryophthoridicola]MCM0158281.1 hypothetical protein [endosymbiont of Metamasius hemipterus]
MINNKFPINIFNINKKYYFYYNIFINLIIDLKNIKLYNKNINILLLNDKIFNFINKNINIIKELFKYNIKIKIDYNINNNYIINLI